MKKAFCLFFGFLCFMVLEVKAQGDEYFKSSERKGFPTALQQLVAYDSVKDRFDYFELGEAAFNSIFYQSLAVENGRNSSFKRFDAILLNKLAIAPTMFPGYQFVLNPLLEKGHFSKHRLSINERNGSVTAHFQTRYIEIVFPEKILQKQDNTKARMLVNVPKGITYNSDGEMNQYSGLSFNEVKGFSMEHSIVPASFIELTKFDRATMKLINDEAYVFPYLVFDNNQLSSFIHSYWQHHSHLNIKEPTEYKSAILLKNVEGLARFDKAISCTISEIYFFENVIAGHIEFPEKEKKNLIKELNKINKVVNRSKLELLENGDFPTVQHLYKDTYYKVEQAANLLKLYFITVK